MDPHTIGSPRSPSLSTTKRLGMRGLEMRSEVSGRRSVLGSKSLAIGEQRLARAGLSDHVACFGPVGRVKLALGLA